MLQTVVENHTGQYTISIRYSGIPISRTLIFSNLPLTQTKSCFPSSVEHCNFTPDFSNSPIFRTNFRFPWRLEKLEFHCRRSVVISQTDYLPELCESATTVIHHSRFAYLEPIPGCKEFLAFLTSSYKSIQVCCHVLRTRNVLVSIFHKSGFWWYGSTPCK